MEVFKLMMLENLNGGKIYGLERNQILVWIIDLLYRNNKKRYWFNKERKQKTNHGIL